jgi:hypothetical protein
MRNSCGSTSKKCCLQDLPNAHMHKVVLLHFKLSSNQTLVNVARKICSDGLITKEITKRKCFSVKQGWVGVHPSIHQK